MPLDKDQRTAVQQYEKALGFVLAHLRKMGDAAFDQKILCEYTAADHEIDRLQLGGTFEYRDAVFRAAQFARRADALRGGGG
jgi:hypothetical protein